MAYDPRRTHEQTDRELLQATHDAIIELQTKWNGGPGSWHVCGDHERRITLVQKRNGWVVKTMLLVIGGGAAIGFLIEHQQLLKLLARP